jgi:hypothetical protein
MRLRVKRVIMSFSCMVQFVQPCYRITNSGPVLTPSVAAYPWTVKIFPATHAYLVAALQDHNTVGTPSPIKPKEHGTGGTPSPIKPKDCPTGGTPSPVKKGYQAYQSDTDSNGTGSCPSSPESQPLTTKASYPVFPSRPISPSTSTDSLASYIMVRSPLQKGGSSAFSDCQTTPPSPIKPKSPNRNGMGDGMGDGMIQRFHNTTPPTPKNGSKK